MAQSIARLSGVFQSGFGVSGGGGSSFYGDSLPFAIPSRRHSYGVEQASYDDARKQSRIPPGFRAYLLEASDVDHFATLGISRGASKREIKSAYRRLARQYHPDVCSGDACTRKFVQIKSAYERALNGVAPMSDDLDYPDEYVEGNMGVGDDSWDEWEEWMGWEGAGTRDYSSHINVNL